MDTPYCIGYVHDHTKYCDINMVTSIFLEHMCMVRPNYIGHTHGHIKFFLAYAWSDQILLTCTWWHQIMLSIWLNCYTKVLFLLFGNPWNNSSPFFFLIKCTKSKATEEICIVHNKRFNLRAMCFLQTNMHHLVGN